jgi:hypothetical protein
MQHCHLTMTFCSWSAFIKLAVFFVRTVSSLHFSTELNFSFIYFDLIYLKNNPNKRFEWGRKDINLSTIMGGYINIWHQCQFYSPFTDWCDILYPHLHCIQKVQNSFVFAITWWLLSCDLLLKKESNIKNKK